MRCPSCDHENIPGAELCAECGLDLAGLDVQVQGRKLDDSVLSRPISSLAITKPLELRPAATVREAVQAMRAAGEDCVFVVDEQAGLVGVFTNRDLTQRIGAPGRDPDSTRLEEVMTPRPVTLQPTDPLVWALHRMGVDGHRHLPLLENGGLVGYLSIRTVLAGLASA